MGRIFKNGSQINGGTVIGWNHVTEAYRVKKKDGFIVDTSLKKEDSLAETIRYGSLAILESSCCKKCEEKYCFRYVYKNTEYGRMKLVECKKCGKLYKI